MTGRRDSEVSFPEALNVWFRVAALSFGGPAGQIAVMHRILVEEKQWVGEGRFLHALNYCMLLPGPEAQQLAIYLGWLLNGVRGGIAAGALFVLPGFLAILVLSLMYVGLQGVAVVEGLFFGVKAAVLAVVVHAVLKLGRRALKTLPLLVIAIAAFTAIFLFGLPFPLIVAAAAVIGLAGGRWAPKRFTLASAHGAAEDANADGLDRPAPRGRAAWLRSAHVILIWGGLWAGPVLVLILALGPDHVFSQIAVFFSKLAVVTFGGAYAVLAYMAQEAVQNFGWLQPGEMLDGLGMAETTPGPLIQVVQFVAFLGAFRDAGGLNPYGAAVLASLLATWVTFIPCFLWIFLGAPYVESLRGNRLLNAGLGAVTAAVVGVILNLAIWFGLHVVFTQISTFQFAGMVLMRPDFASMDWAALVVTVAALIAILRLRVNVVAVIAVCAAAGIAYRMVSG